MSFEVEAKSRLKRATSAKIALYCSNFANDCGGPRNCGASNYSSESVHLKWEAFVDSTNSLFPSPI